MTADCAEVDTHVIGQIHNFRRDKNLTGTVTKSRGPALHGRTSRTSPRELISASRMPQKMQRAARHNSFSVRLRSISLCEEQLADHFRRPRKNPTNHEIFTFGASGLFDQKYLKKPKGETSGMISTPHTNASSEILLIKTREHWRRVMSPQGQR